MCRFILFIIKFFNDWFDRYFDFWFNNLLSDYFIILNNIFYIVFPNNGIIISTYLISFIIFILLKKEYTQRNLIFSINILFSLINIYHSVFGFNFLFCSFLLFLWSIVQSIAFWFPMVIIIDAFKNVQYDLVALMFFAFIIVNFIVGFLSIFILGQFDKDEEKHFLFKSIINGLCGSIRLPMHVLISIILLFNDVPIDWGCYDNDNWVSIIIYSATLLDIEPSWGDFPDRINDHDSSPKYIKKLRNNISNTPNHALKPFVTESDGRLHGPNDVLNQARSVAKYCSTYVEEKQNRIDINFEARLSGNTVYFYINLNRTKFKGFPSQYDLDNYNNQVMSSLDRQQDQILDLMKKYAEKNDLDREYSVVFEKGTWNI